MRASLVLDGAGTISGIAQPLVAAIMFEFDVLAYAVLTLFCLALLYSLSG
jgi:hypothetical protein